MKHEEDAHRYLSEVLNSWTFACKKQGVYIHTYIYINTYERTAIKMKIGQGLVNYIMLLVSKMTMMIIRILTNESVYFRQKSQQRLP